MHNRTGFWGVLNALLVLVLLGAASCGGGSESVLPDPNGVRPAITSIAPASGNVGDRIVISGLNFGNVQAGSRVMMGGLDFTVNSWSDTQIDVTIATGMSSGLIEVLVNGLVSQSATQAQLFIPTRPGGSPILTTLNPDFGRVGTDTITLIGENFGAQASGKVLFTAAAGGTVEANVVTTTIGGVAVAQWSDTSIGVFIPASATTGPIRVQAGTVTSNSLTFTALPAPDGLNPPVITAVTSNDENIGIGSVISVAGTFFGNQQGGSTITLNGLNLQVVNWTATKIDAIIPVGATSGTVNVTVAGSMAVSENLVVGNRPTISGVAPSQIKIGDPITIFGQYFGFEQGAGTLQIGTVTVPVASWNDTTITVAAMPPVTADSKGNIPVIVTTDPGLSSAPFAAMLTSNIKGSIVVTPTAGVVGVTQFSFVVNVSGGSDNYEYRLVSDKNLPNATEPATTNNPITYTYKGTQMGTLDQKQFDTMLIVTDKDTQESVTIDGPSVLVVAAGQPVITRMAVSGFNRGNVRAPNDWMYIGNGSTPRYHAFTFHNKVPVFASDLFETISEGQAVPTYPRDESAYTYTGATPRALAYRYNTTLGSETAPGSIVRIEGMNFGIAQGGIQLASGSLSSVTLGPADFLDWTDTYVEFRVPGNLNQNLSGKVKIITANGKEFISTDDLICSAYISGFSPLTDVNPGGQISFTGFDFTPPQKPGEIGGNIYLFWVIRASYTDPFTATPKTELALVKTPFAPDAIGNNQLSFNMARLDNVEVEVLNDTQTASAMVPATQAGGGDYFCFIWTGAVTPFSTANGVVANSGVMSQAVRVPVGAGGGPAFTANLQADSVNVNTGVPVNFDFSATGGTAPYTNFTIVWDDGTADFSSATAGTTPHAFGLAGTYNVQLTVTDTAANTATDTVVITVSGGPPPPGP